MGRRLIFDAETDGLLRELTTFHNIGMKDYDTKEKFMFTSREDNIEEGVRMLEEAESLVGHNILGFDLLAVEKLYPWADITARITDTLVMSRLLWANRQDLDVKLVINGTLSGKNMGKHGLEGWGERLGYPKGDFSDWCKDRDIDPWEEFPEEGEYVFDGKIIKEKDKPDREIPEGTWLWSEIYDMRTDYCEQDVEVTEQLLDLELDTMELWDFPTLPSYIEHRFEEIMGFAQRDGFCLNVDKAEKLEKEILAKLEECNTAAAEAFPPKYEPKKGYMYFEHVKSKHDELLKKQDAKVSKAESNGKTVKTYDFANLTAFMDFCEEEELGEMAQINVAARTSKVTHKFPDGTKMQFIMEAGTPSTPIEFVHFNPNSRPQIVVKLLELGWEPEEYTKAGNPSTAGDILEKAAEIIPVALPLAGGLKCTKIKGYIRSKEGAKKRNGWLDIVSEDGKIHARTIHIGAVTHRVSISRPNIGQIPAITFYPKDHELVDQPIMGFEGGWGWECRECFEVPEGWCLMGTDLSGIEIRLLAEEMKKFDDGAYIDIVLDGDIHTTNQEAAGLPTRGAAKTFLYACVPLDTTALTVDGWKGYDELEVGELVMTYNQKDNVKEWKPILEKVYYDDAEVVRMSHGQSFDVRSTPNHRWFVNQRRRAPDYRLPYLIPLVKTTEEVNTESNIVNNAPLRDNRELEPYDFGRVNDKPKYEIDWVAEVLKMSESEMKSFLAGFMIADGSYQYGHAAKSNGHWKWTQNFGNLQEASLMATYLAHDGRVHVHSRFDTPTPMKTVHLNNKAHTTGQKLRKEQLENQPVWCIRTENESFVMRQGDCITITGNTIYGIGNLALGGQLDPYLNEAQKVKLGKSSKKKFFSSIPAAKKSIKEYEKQAKNGYITAIDGRRVPVDSGHKGLNSRLQNAGAVIAKLWVIYMYDAMIDEGYVNGYDGDFVIAGFIHDETQNPCRTEEIAERMGEIATEQSIKVGEFFGITIPIKSEYKIGKSWAETH